MRESLIWAVILGFFLLVAIFFLYIFPTPLNYGINNYFVRVDRSCNTSSDCVSTYGAKECSGVFGCVNKNWNPNCPLPVPIHFDSVSPPYYTCGCQNNICIEVPKP